jgi:serine phosphatase RsbU (regulator of sigma subunit)
MALGIFEDNIYKYESEKTEIGEVLLQYTDGVPEAISHNGAFKSQVQLFNKI